MSITSQLPPISLTQAGAGMRALANGQTIEARVLGPSANGTTQVQVGRQVLNLTLPQQQPVGATLTLSVAQSDGQLQLSLVSVRPPEAPQISVQQGSLATPATSVQLSPTALSASPASSGASAAPAAEAVASRPAATAQAPQAISNRSVSTESPAQTAYTANATSQAGAATQVTSAAGAPSNAPATPPTGSASAQPLPLGQAGSAQTQATVASSPPPVQSALAQGAAPPGSSAQPAGTQQPVQATIPAGVSALPAAGAAPATVAPSAGGVPVRVDIPYAVAAPAVGPATVSSVARPAAPVVAPIVQATAAGALGQQTTSSNFSGSPMSATPMPAAPQGPANPQAALAQMVQQALPRQDSVLSLTGALTAIAGKVALPEPVAKAAQQLLAARTPLDGGKLTGAVIKSAVQQSGIFQEAMLASGQGQAAAGDVKSALLALRQGLGAWLGNQAPVAQVGSVPPPLRGHVPRARAGEGQPPDIPDDPLEIGKMLLERTDAALHRVRLHQNASLPDPNQTRQDTQWSMDLPVIVGGQQQVLHLQIQRDAEQDAERPEDRGWQVRFAINLAERGEVGAQVSLRAKNTSVLLWSDHEDTARSLAIEAEALREELAEVGLVPGAIVVRAGTPHEEPQQPANGAGHVVDAER